MSRIPVTSKEVDPVELRARVGKRIRAVAWDRRLTLAAVATAAGISRAMLHSVLSGRTAATTDTLAKLAKALQVDPMELLRPPPQPQTKQAKASKASKASKATGV